MRLSLSLFLVAAVFLSLDGNETLIKINIIGFALHLTNVCFFSLGIPVFPFITWDVWNWKPSSFSKVGSKQVFFCFLFSPS